MTSELNDRPAVFRPVKLADKELGPVVLVLVVAVHEDVVLVIIWTGNGLRTAYYNVVCALFATAATAADSARIVRMIFFTFRNINTQPTPPERFREG